MLPVALLSVRQGQIIVGIEKSRLELDCLEVKLNGPIEIPELLRCDGPPELHKVLVPTGTRLYLQSVPEVRVSLCKLRLDPDTLLIIKHALAKIPQLEVNCTQEKHVLRAAGIDIIQSIGQR